MKVSVIGYGTMGKGIAQVFAQNGHTVYLVGYDLKKVEKAKSQIFKVLKDLVLKKKKMHSAIARSVINNIHASLGEELPKSDLIIEAVPEDMKLKKKLFKKYSGVCKSNAIIATNTSSLSITELASSCKNQGRFIGMHFFNPAPVMPLVEVIKGKKTSKATYDKIIRLTKKLSKTPVTSKDYPGFIANYMLIPFINDAINLADKKIASVKDIDTTAKLGLGHPMGPLELGDFIGLDIVLHISRTLQKKLGQRYKPAPLLVKMVKKKKLGRKTKQGFYKY